MSSRSGLFAFALAAMSASALFVGTALGQGAAGPLPDNAHAETYGNGWECNHGFSETDGTCAPIQLPANAYLTSLSYGRGWDCKRGFREIRRTCDAFEIPANAFLNAAGNGWKCHRGYQNSRNSCAVVEVPENGFLNDASYGTGWSCNRGFEPINQSCRVLKLPANTHLDFSGNRWECDPPLRRRSNNCVVP